MSGGTFDYKQHRVTDIADCIKDHLERNEEMTEKLWCGLGPEALEAMRICEVIIRLAGDLAHHADWRYAGDTADDTFVKRVQEAFEKIGDEVFALQKPGQREKRFDDEQTGGGPMIHRYEKRVLDVCVLLHMHNSGAFMGLSTEEAKAQVAFLRQRLRDWHEGHKNWKAFDDLVKKLVETTLEETARHNPDCMVPEGGSHNG